MNYANPLLRALAVLVIALSCAPLLHSQDSPQDRGSIGGTVVDGVTQQPLSGAEVTLRGPVGSQASSAQSAATGADGHFTFNSLAAGRYIVWASHSGYLHEGHGGRNRSPVLLAGQHIDDMVVSLLPDAVIAGHVIDEKGRPLSAASIHAMKATSQRSMRDLDDVAQTTTNESGEYRFSGLNPGEYLLRASYTPKAGVKLPARSSYAPICYPGTSDFSSCQSLSVRAGEEMAGIDLTFTPVRTAHIDGIVVNAENSSPVAESQVSLLVDQKGALVPLADASADAKGHFQFSNVAPGDYSIVAQRELKARSGGTLWGMKSLSLADTNVSLKVEIFPGVAVRGRIRIEGNAQPNLEGMVVAIEPMMKSTLLPLSPQPEDANVQPDGSFAFHDVMEGTYRVSAFPLPPGMYLKAANPEILDTGIAIGHAATTIDLALNPGVGKIQGTVTGSDQACSGLTVLMVPENRSPDPRDFRRAFTDQSCRFTFRNVVPGDYKLFAWQTLANTALMDPGFIDQFQDQGESVRLKEAGEAEVQVVIIPAGDSSR